MAVDCRLIAEQLASYRFNASGERELQDGLLRAFEELGLEPVREVNLDTRNRIDFLLAGGVGVEAKVDGSLSDVRRQVERYVAFPAIQALVLVTTRVKHRGLPSEMGGKPVFVVHLEGNAW